MKSVSIIAIAIFALVALCSSVPIADQLAETEARVDIYNDFLVHLFSGLVGTTFNTASSFLNQLITENPLGIGKREAEGDLAARIDFLTFFYDNILQDLFGGLVTNTFGTLSNTLTNLIQTNPLGLGKREAEGDLAARIDFLTFFYDNILQDLFGGLVTNTFNTLGSTLTNLIQTNPLGIGKRAADGLNVNIFQFLYDNILSDLFSGLASNTANHLQGALTSLLNKPLAILGRRSVDIEQAQAVIIQTVSTLVEKFKIFAKEAVAAVSSDRQQLNQLAKDVIAEIKATITQLAKQLSQLIPSAITTEVSEVLAALQSTLVYWTSGLAGSLGPVIGPFRP
jgi:hypothetical protein